MKRILVFFMLLWGASAWAQGPLPFNAFTLKAYAIGTDTVPVEQSFAEAKSGVWELDLYGPDRDQRLLLQWNGRVGIAYFGKKRCDFTFPAISAGSFIRLVTEDRTIQLFFHTPQRAYGAKLDPTPDWRKIVQVSYRDSLPGSKLQTFEPVLREWELIEGGGELYLWEGAHRELLWNPATGGGVVRWREQGSAQAVDIPFRLGANGEVEGLGGYTLTIEFEALTPKGGVVSDTIVWSRLQSVEIPYQGFFSTVNHRRVFKGTDREGDRWDLYSGEEKVGYLMVLPFRQGIEVRVIANTQASYCYIPEQILMVGDEFVPVDYPGYKFTFASARK